MFFDSIKKINRLRKEINRLFSKDMSNILLNSYYWGEKLTFSKLWFSRFKHLVATLKSALGAKKCVAFLSFSFRKELWHFRPDNLMQTYQTLRHSPLKLY